MTEYTPKDIARFWSKVAITANPEKCWEWQRGCKGSGYGSIEIHYKTKMAHRVAYELTYGQIPSTICVCHSCDNPICCNPAHLFLGTYADNNRDRTAKGRTVAHKGEKHSMHKLTREQVEYIRQEYSPSKRNQSKLARHFGISQATVWNIVNNNTWKD